MTPTPVSPEEVAWTQVQSVDGSPSLPRLAAAFRAAGWEPLELALSDDGEFINFSLRCGDQQSHMVTEKEDSLRILIRAFRLAGFPVGFSEVAIDAFDSDFLTGGTLVEPLEWVCEHGLVPVDL